MNYRKRRRRRQAIRRLFIYVFLIAALFFGTQYYYTESMLEPVDISDDTNISFEIESGTSLKEVSDNLKERDLIKSASVFRNYLKRQDLDMNVKAGNFILTRYMTAEEIAQKITSDQASQEAVTIQEGLTISEIDDKLSRMGLIEPNELKNFSINTLSEEDRSEIPSDFLAILEENGSNLEGLLFPDTYFINPISFTIEDFVIRLLITMDSKFTEDMKNSYTADGRTLYEVLNMASIIEKEVRTDDDLAIVSGILWKRYDSNWQIGADATLVYVTENADITRTDLELDSAYNTRKFLGLPPTPISSPSMKSINAAVYPKSSDYWYYLTTLDTGEVVYATTNEEHNINRAKYLP